MDNEILQILQSMNKKMDVMGDKVDYLYSMKDKIESIDEIRSKVDSLYSMKDKIESIDEINSKVDSLYEMKDKVDSLYSMKDKIESIDEIKSKVDSLYSMKDKIESIDEINSKVDSLYSMKDKVDSIDERLSALEDVVTVMQYEHGRKLDLLLDYAKASIEKHEQYDKQFDYVYSKMFDYDVRLSVIEDSEHFQNVMAKKAAFIRKFADKGKEIVESQNKKIAQYNPNNK